jgi:signal transduction histidine kinase/ActR/RegA family two-component response regulator
MPGNGRRTTTPDLDRLRQENQELRRRVEEAEEALRALSAGEVDAILIDAGRVFTLDQAEKPYWLLVAQVPHPAATLTAKGTIISCNHRFADLLLQPLQALPGKPIQDFVADAGRTVLESLLRDGLAAEVQGEVMLQVAGGAPQAAYLGVRPLREGIHGECLMLTDLSERQHYQELKRTQEALRASEEELRSADRKKDAFLATLAHELRNPLAPIRNAAQILKAKGPLQPELEWGRAVIDRQAELMARLLDDLLDVSRISLKKVELRTEPVELASVCEAALETSRPLIEAGGHELSVSLPAEPILLEADPLRLAQVLSNLLNNAAKYTHDGGRIWLGAERQGAEVVVLVRDSGIGIDAEALPSVFEIFSQAKPTLARGHSGLGIGLSLVKGLVELHGGSVEARSDGPGRGSEFLVRLPVAARTAGREPARPREDEEPPATGSRILIVDDNRDGADSLAMLLEIMGNRVRTAYDGEQALEATEAMRPEVVLLDLGMPKLSGYDVCRRIREQPWGRDVVLIALTGWGQEADRRRTEAAGFDRHMVKPVHPADLMRLLASFLQERGGRLGEPRG